MAEVALNIHLERILQLPEGMLGHKKYTHKNENWINIVFLLFVYQVFIHQWLIGDWNHVGIRKL